MKVQQSTECKINSNKLDIQTKNDETLERNPFIFW